MFPILSHTRMKVYHMKHVLVRLKTNKSKWLSMQQGKDLSSTLPNNILDVKVSQNLIRDCRDSWNSDLLGIINRQNKY